MGRDGQDSLGMTVEGAGNGKKESKISSDAAMSHKVKIGGRNMLPVALRCHTSFAHPVQIESRKTKAQNERTMELV